jgi:hypothetical protein
LSQLEVEVGWLWIWLMAVEAKVIQ